MIAGGRLRRFALAPPRGALAAAALTSSALVPTASTAPAAPPIVAAQTTTFSAYTPLASNAGIASRMLTPLTAARMRERIAKAHETLADQPVDLNHERFRVFVPRDKPSSGRFGLLVFIPPWEDDHIPEGWSAVLEKHGTIFVSPVNAGNAVSPLGRRVPLALLAAYNVMTHYPVDPERVFIGGFSGGSRIALRLAVAYPDLFRGAFLDAGADPVGGQDVPLPDRALFDRFRSSSRMVFFTGALDEDHLLQASESTRALRRWCAADPVSRVEQRLGHEVAPASGLSWALLELEKPRPPASSVSTRCSERIDDELHAALASANAALTSGDLGASRKLLDQIDRRFGGLAAPDTVAMARTIAASSNSDEPR